MTNGISGIGGAQTPTDTSATTATSKATLGKDDFLKLLVAQLSHQDPTQPMQGTEFVTQLSQFSLVEQAVAQSSKLDVLTTQMTGLGNSQATALVGKQVTIHGSGIAFDGTLATTSNVTLGGAAQDVKVTIKDAQGNPVRTMDLGPHQAGVLAVTWDGRTDAGQMAPKGSYTMSVNASGANGSPVDVSQDVSGVVTKVSYDKGYPELLLDSGATAPVSDLVSVASPPPAPAK